MTEDKAFKEQFLRLTKAMQWDDVQQNTVQYHMNRLAVETSKAVHMIMAEMLAAKNAHNAHPEGTLSEPVTTDGAEDPANAPK